MNPLDQLDPYRLARNAAHHTGIIATHLRPYIEWLATRTPDGYGAGGGGGEAVCTSGTSNPTLRAVLGRVSLDEAEPLPAEVYEELMRDLATIDAYAAKVAAAVVTYPITAVREREVKRQCSTGVGVPDVQHWQRDPLCPNLAEQKPSYRGMCGSCYSAWRRWSIKAGVWKGDAA